MVIKGDNQIKLGIKFTFTGKFLMNFVLWMGVGFSMRVFCGFMRAIRTFMLGFSIFMRVLCHLMRGNPLLMRMPLF